MKRLFIGHKTGVGPVVKVMESDSDDPLTTPNTDWHKYRFNSEVQEIGYAYEKVEWSFLGVDWWSACPNGAGTPNYGGFAYYPGGATNVNCEVAVAATHTPSDTLRYFSIFYALDRLTDLSYRSILFNSRLRSDWTKNWEIGRASYPGSSDARYVAWSLNDVQTTDRQVYHDGNLPDIGRVILLSAPYIIGFPRKPQGSVTSSSHPTGVVFTDLFQKLIYSSNKSAADYTEDRIIYTELPIEDDDYPPVIGSFVANKKIVRIDPSVVKVAKPGFDVDTATRDQLIVSSDKVPMKVVKAGSFTLAAGASNSIAIAYPITARCFVETQVNVTGQTLLIPPYPDNNVDEIKLEHRIVGQTIEFRNQASVSLDCRYFVLADDWTDQSTGSASVFDVTEDSHVTIRKPGTAGTSGRDVLLDTRAAWLPIVAQGWVPKSAITEASDVTRYGSHKYQVSITNTGFKPLVIARAKFEIREAPGKYLWTDFYAKNIEIYGYMSCSTFIAKITDSNVTFYVDRDSTRAEDAYRIGSYYGSTSTLQFVGLRYYVFACPTSI